MSFSAIQSDAKTELDVVLSIADKFSVIMDQKKLKDAVQFAYGLTEEEKERTKTAQAFIQKYTDIVVQNDEQIKKMADAEAKRQEDVSNAAAALDAAKKDIIAKQTILDSTLKDIAEKQKALDGQAATIKQSYDDFAVIKQNFEASKRDFEMQVVKLGEDKEALAFRQKQVTDYETALKAKASQLQKLTEGM